MHARKHTLPGHNNIQLSCANKASQNPLSRNHYPCRRSLFPWQHLSEKEEQTSLFDLSQPVPYLKPELWAAL